MGTVRRFVSDESGMTLALAMMMVLLIGVMGAGLLTFVNSDLNTLTEENRGQRAFEVADAGIEAAKRQLSSNVVRTDYDSVSPDIQWSKAQGGLTLNNLDGDATTSDSVNVTIKYCAEASSDSQCAVAGSPPSVEYFRVVSTGTYGDLPQQAMRRIEARFEGIEAGAGAGETIGHPVYYTKGTIKITQDSIANNPVSLNQVSLYTQGDILIPDHPTYHVRNRTEFVTDMTDSQGSVTRSGGADELCDWNSKTPLRGCFEDGTDGGWNTVSRTIQTPGMAAEDKICSYDSATSTSECGSSASIADGVYGFDSTTNPRFVAKACQLSGSTTCPDNATGTMSFPFPLPRPIPSGLKAAACHPPGTNTTVCPKTPPPVSYFEGNPTSSTWGLNNNNASNSRVAFIDAQNKT